MNIYLCPSPELYPLYHRDGASVIITDIFRASTTIVTALSHGAKAVLPVEHVEDCQRIGQAMGYLMAAERQVMRCDFAHLGNDPLTYTRDVVEGQTIVFSTTNGTRSLEIAKTHGAEEILIGSFLNLSNTLQYLQKRRREEVLVVAAGWQGQMSLEDCLYAGALACHAETLNWGKASGDACLMASTIWRHECSSPESLKHYILQSEHYTRLDRAGLATTVDYCLKERGGPVILLNDDGYLRGL